MSAGLDRKDQAIWDALEANKTKQALQLCAKRLKKGEKGDYLYALRAYVLVRGQSSSHQEEGYYEIKRLAEKDPAIVDGAAISLLHLALDNVDGLGIPGTGIVRTKELGSKLWERALRARPKDERLAEECFFVCLTQTDWAMAQKAAMALQKMSSKREYYFWAIVCCHMLSVSKESSKQDQKLFGTLAYRMISKAASNDAADVQVSSSSSRSIQNASELHLLLLVYRTQGYVAEARQILMSPNLGIDSAIAKAQWRFVRDALDALEELADWQELWTFCDDLLRKDGSSDESEQSSDVSLGLECDWRMFQSYIRANSELDNAKMTEATKDVIESYLDESRPGRNPLLAKLLFIKSQISRGKLPRASTELLSACQRYFEAFGTKNCCYNDLREHIGDLDSEARLALCAYMEGFCGRLASADDSDNDNDTRRMSRQAAKVNSLKLRYHMLSLDQPSVESLTSFLTEAIGIYKGSFSLDIGNVADYRPGDDAGILTAMALVRLAEVEKHEGTDKAPDTRLLQAAALLTFLDGRSGNNHQALLILTRLYLILGVGSLAFNKYRQLSIKHLQSDSSSHHFFTRISTSFPWPAKDTFQGRAKRDDLDPQIGLQQALKLYAASRVQTPRMIKLAVEEGNYAQVPEFSDFAGRLDTSVCRFMWQIELRRVLRHRTTGSSAPQESILGRLEADPFDVPSFVTDQRDDAVVANYEPPGHMRFEEHIRLGPKPAYRWVAAFSISEQMFARLRTAAGERPGSREAVTNGLEKLNKELRQILDTENLAEEFTEAELEYLGLVLSVLETLRSGATYSSDIGTWLQKKAAGEKEAAIENGLHALSLEPRNRYPKWDIFHGSFLTLEGLRLVKAFVEFHHSRSGKADNRKLKSALSEPHDDILRANKQLRDNVAQWRNGLSESGVVGALVDSLLEKNDNGEDQGPVGVAIEGLTGEPWMESFASTVVDAWVEALDGVLRVKID